LQTAALLGYQKSLDELCNPEELQFQIVHPGEELWMKLLAYPLLDIDERLLERATHRAVTLFGRRIAQGTLRRPARRRRETPLFP
jgi:tryptophan 2,3-dioxygenase